MEKNKHDLKRQKAIKLVAVILVIALTLGIIAPFMSMVHAMNGSTGSVAIQIMPVGNKENIEPEIENDNFDMEVNVGFDGEYVVNKITPVEVIVTNKGEDFSGEIQIKVYVKNDYYYDDGKEPEEYIIYYESVDLPMGTSKEITMNVDFTTIKRVLKVSLVDSNDKEIMSKNTSIYANSPYNSMTGILTDNRIGLNYLNRNGQMPTYEGDYQGYNSSYPPYSENYDKIEYETTLDLTAETFPETFEVMQNFGTIIINDFDTSKLSNEQIEALSKWVDSGGLLVLGLGPNANNVISGLDEVIDIQINETKVITSFLDSSGEYENDLSEYGDMHITNVYIENAQEMWTDGANSISQIVTVGRGHVIVHSFDLSLAPISNAVGMGDYLHSVYSKYSTSVYETGGYNSVSYTVGNMHILDNNNTYITIIIIIVYVIIIGPVLFLFLKKKDKGVRGWVIIPTIALIVTGIIYVGSLNSIYKDSIANVVSVVEIEPGQSRGLANIYAGIRSPKSGEVSFESDEKFNITDVFGYNYYYYRQQVYSKNNCIAKINTGNTTSVTLFDNETWDVNSYYLSKNIDMGGTLDPELTFDGNRLKGQIINNTNRDFYDIIICVQDNIIKYDSILAGETLDINFKLEGKLREYYDQYAMAREAYGLEDSYFDYQKIRDDIKSGLYTEQDIYTIYKRVGILENTLWEYNIYNNSYTDVSNIAVGVFAFDNSNLIEGQMSVNGKKPTEFYENLYCTTIEVDLSKSSEFNLPYGLLKYNRLNTSEEGMLDWDIYTSKDGELEFEYNLPKNTTITGFQFKWEDSYGAIETKSIYNVLTGEWEYLETAEYTDTDNYIDENGLLKVKCEVNANYEVPAPQIKIRGGGNNA